MSRLAFGVCGEGRGHAARALALMERLGAGHEFLVASSGEALDFLSSRLASGCRFVEVPGLKFRYTGGRIDLTKSILSGLRYAAFELSEVVGFLRRELDLFGPDVVVADFEPAVARAANDLGVPLMSLDHQHFLVSYELGILPARLQWHAWLMGLAVRMYVPRADRFLVSAFFKPPLRKSFGDFVQIGSMIRSSILGREPSDGGYILSYLRRNTPSNVIGVLSECGLPVKVYGLGKRDSIGSVSFFEVDEERFSDDLVGCRAVVAAAGNQLIGEALHLGKPFFALPEAAHSEQLINAHFLKAMGCGDFVVLDRLDCGILRRFVEGLGSWEDGLFAVRGRLDGVSEVVKILKEMEAV